MSNATRIENWSFATSNAYTPPECMGFEIRGHCFNHPKLPDGSFVSTAVVVAELTRFMSYSGRVWKLGEPGVFWQNGPDADKEVTPEYFLERFSKVAMGRKRAGNPMRTIDNETKIPDWTAVGECCDYECLERGQEVCSDQN